jgi:hypothetical protein
MKEISPNSGENGEKATTNNGTIDHRFWNFKLKNPF